MEEAVLFNSNITTSMTLTEFMTVDGIFGNGTNNVLNPTNTTNLTSGRNKK